MRLRHVVWTVALVGAACHKAPPAPTHFSVAIEPGYLQFIHAGDHLPLVAKALDPTRTAVPGTRFTWHSADTSVARVQDGVVTALKDGITRIWAVTGQDSSFAVAVVQLPRVVALTLQPALAHFDALGDTTTLALNNPDSLVGPKPMCMADDDKVAVIDTTYRVHSVGNGTTLVRCRAGEAEGSMRVTVQQRMARVGIVTGVTRTLRLERDTIHLALAKVDKMSTPMDVGTPTWRSLDTSVVTVDPSSGTAIGKVEGTGRVVAVLNGLADTTELQVIAREPSMMAQRSALRVTGAPGTLRGPRGVPGGGGVRGTPDLGPRPVSTAISARDILTSDSVFQAQTLIPGGSTASPLHLSLTVIQADHILDEGAGKEETSGLMFGGEMEIRPSPTFTIRFEAAYAPELAGSTVGTQPEAVGLGTLDLGLGLFPWLSLKLGGGYRGSRQLGRLQQWYSLRTGAEARFDLGGAAVGVIEVAALPLVAGTPAFTEGNPFGIVSSAGLDYHTGKLALGARYELERYAFPGDQRKEQFATLKFRLGLNLGGQ